MKQAGRGIEGLGDNRFKENGKERDNRFKENGKERDDKFCEEMTKDGKTNPMEKR